MIEARSDVLLLIFAIFALGFVVLTLPMGILVTSMSNRLAVRR
jgi:glutamate transport system permease protein